MNPDTVTFTPEMIETVQKILKHHLEFDGNEFKLELRDTGEIAPCSLTQAFFPEIIDMALEHLKRKASYSLVEWIEQEEKTCNVEYKDGEFRLKNKPLPLYDWSLVK